MVWDAALTGIKPGELFKLSGCELGVITAVVVLVCV
jgi:hypothetical protein